MTASCPATKNSTPRATDTALSAFSVARGPPAVCGPLRCVETKPRPSAIFSVSSRGIRCRILEMFTGSEHARHDNRLENRAPVATHCTVARILHVPSRRVDRPWL